MVASIVSLLRAPARYRAETPWGVVGATAATVFVILAPILIALVGVVIAALLGAESASLDQLEGRLQNVNSLEGVSALMGTQLISLALVWWFAGRKGMRWETLSLASPAPSYAKCIAIGLAVVLVIGLVELGLYNLFKFDLFKDSQWLVEGLRSPFWLFTIFMAVVLAPLWEELVFRGFLLSALAKTRLGIVGAGLISTTLWTLLHWGYSVPAMISVFSAGLILTWLVWKTDSLRVAIVTHAVGNLTAIAFAWAFSPY